MSSVPDDGAELFVVGVSVEPTMFTGPDLPPLPAVTLTLQASDRPGGAVRNLRVHFQAAGMEGIGDAIADAAVDAITRADRRAAHSLTLVSPSGVDLPKADAAPAPATTTDGPAAVLVRRLRNVGIDVDGVWDLVEADEPCPSAIPFLLEALLESEPADANFREGVVRALSIRQARPVAAPVLVHEMRRQQEHDDLLVLWAFGNALSIAADDTVYDDVVALATDRSLGRAREMLMDALARMDNPGATDVLVQLVDDEDVDGNAVVALSRRRDAPVEVLADFTDDDRAWVRRAAASAISRQAGEAGAG